MRQRCILFGEPATPALVAGGYHRDWPDARGIFCNDSQDFVVWVNEKDHMRIITTEEGPDLQHAFRRFCVSRAFPSWNRVHID
jgi:creatine kinase